MRHEVATAYFYNISSNTTNISNLRTRDLLDFSIPLPPLAEQKRIVAHLTEQTEAAERARRAADTALADLRAVPSALLRRALAGAS